MSCIMVTPPNRLKKNFSNCYDGKPTGIEKKLAIDGCYSMQEIIEWSEKTYRFNEKGKLELVTKDSTTTYFMFYRDGTVIYNFFDYNNNIKNYFIRMQSDIRAKKSFENNFDWGKYIIKGDSILIQWINHPAPLAPTWMANELWFRILDKNKLQFIQCNSLDPLDREGKSVNHEVQVKYLDAEFVPLEVRPDSNCWLKNKRWFWCDKEKYKAWKKSGGNKHN
jgi:hypothetical protein